MMSASDARGNDINGGAPSATKAPPRSTTRKPARTATGAPSSTHHAHDDELSCASILALLRRHSQRAQHGLSRNHVMFFLKQHIPILEWLPSYDFREDLQYDLVAGVTVGMMIVPQEISLSTMMGVPPIYGLYTAAVVPLIYPLFGTSRVLSVANGTELSLLVGSAIKKIESVDERVATGILLSFLTGLMLLLMGIFRLGIIADFFSRPVMGGFISAGGVLIMLSQCANWLGVKVPSRDLPFLTVLDLIEQSPHLNGNSFLLGILSIAILVGMRLLKRRVVRELATLEDELEDAFAYEEAAAVAHNRQSLHRSDEHDGEEEENDDDDDDGTSAYDDIELGAVASGKRANGATTTTNNKPATNRRTAYDAGFGTPRQGASTASASRWQQHVPTVFTTGSLRRSDLLASPWAPGARHLDSVRGSSSDGMIDMGARSCRHADSGLLTRSTRHRLGVGSNIDDGVGFSLSDADYLTRDQEQPVRTAHHRTTDDAVTLRRSTAFVPSLVRSTSETSVLSRSSSDNSSSRPTPRRRKLSMDATDDALTAQSITANTVDVDIDSNSEDDDDDVETGRRTNLSTESQPLPPKRRMKNMASPAESLASDTDSACSTTALTRDRSSSTSDASSLSIRILRSKIAVLIALRLVCELGAFTVCLIGGIIGYLSPKGALVLTGAVPGGFPSPVLPWYGFLTHVIETDRLYHIIIDTLSIAIIAYMSSIAMAKRLALKEGYRVRPNQELIALGFSNLVGAFFQAMPATGGLSRTAVNMQNARTQLASVITVSVVVLALYTATSALAYLPKTSLAAIILVAGESLIELKEAKWLYRVKRDEFFVWLASFVLTVTLGVLPGLLSSIFCSLVAVIYKTRRPMLTMLGEVVDDETGAQSIVDLELFPDAAQPLIDIVAIRVEGALYFANCEYIERVIERELQKRQQQMTTTTDDDRVHVTGVHVSGVVIDAGSIMDWDSTTIQMMKHLQVDLALRGIQLSIVNARDRLYRLLESSDYLDGIVLQDARIGFPVAIAAIRARAAAMAEATMTTTTTLSVANREQSC